MERFDHVIVGGGAAGCVLAARLSEDPRRRVLLLEAGEAPTSVWIRIPAGFSRTWKNPALNWRFFTEPEEGTAARAIDIPRGKGLGGSTLINGMIWVRGQAEDFDGWAQQGATGWSFSDVAPHFRRIEHFPEGDAAVRGQDGPHRLETVRERQKLPEAFVEAGVEAGWPRNPDYNGASQEGFCWYQVSQRQGRRWTAYDSYLKPAMTRPNLAVRTGAQVVGLDIAEGRCTGLRYRVGEAVMQVEAGAVTLAAGAVQSPHLLELSGIGDPDVLAAAGLPVVHALPGVGANYMDHFCARLNWRVRGAPTLNETSRGWRLLPHLLQYALGGRGILSYGTGIAGGFVKTAPHLATPDLQYFFAHASYATAADRVLDSKPGMTIGVTQLRPRSRGTIHVKAPDPLTPPAIRPNFLADPEDAHVMAEGMRIAREIAAQPALARYTEYEMNPGPDCSDEAALIDFARRTGQTIYHPSGTARMGSDDGAVTDPRLRVRGIEGLRVADASVMPTIVSANTQAAVMMIAEKAAAMIAEDERA
jgi:choline dehydrogenase-like flavoprotein